ncbi:polyprenyl synthetase family protein [Crateriforma conspicua]|uniref:All-trans-nonaprenyl-diphosphate synthase (Geranyl-diphosphate specific) n=1 Tax=Crateriforma conspicua TaxID=2527996 RepID=A0A5C5Y4G6_9PLAN|nr:polyprenyl synthetase family protein [Crateriforma conspicua]TWT69195.1 All-trans-nonaprenyl-diphosphate synthase (geranyl-diphosphate specific) [Crateriforma conspicua]
MTRHPKPAKVPESSTARLSPTITAPITIRFLSTPGAVGAPAGRPPSGWQTNRPDDHLVFASRVHQQKEIGLSTGLRPSEVSGAATASPVAPSNEPKGRRKTSHLKEVPPTLELRESLRARCAEVAARLPRDAPLTKDEMELVARQTLQEADLPESYVGWMMVMLSSEFWRDQLASVPPERRLFLLPHCLKHAEGCPADYDQFGMNCKECGACSIADFRGLAEDMGYRVLVAEGSPVVMKIIVGGYVDAVIGVACLNVLEKAIDKVLLAGIPCMAVPLLSSDCRNTKVDEPWVDAMIRTPYQPAKAKTRSYVHLMRAASELCGPESLNQLAPRVRGDLSLGEQAVSREQVQTIDPIAATEHIAYDFLHRGGKHSRPFITLASYDAMTGGKLTEAADHDDTNADDSPSDAQRTLNSIPEAVRRAALCIETFHKASLVHDDIEDDDAYRYGQLAVHRRFGLSTAINVGDYLIGLGYRLLSRRGTDDSDASIDDAARLDVLDNLAAAHTRLSEGQGAELLWRDTMDRSLEPIDALKVYALKTSPAFEAALFSGIRLAGDATEYVEPIRKFCRNLGVAFQILNDIGDFSDPDNKVVGGGDVLGGRPTLLYALALQSLDDRDSRRLMELATPREDAMEKENSERLAEIRRLYHRGDVFSTAMTLVDKHQARAEQVADEISPDSLRRLLYFLVDTVLQRPDLPSPDVVSLGSLPVTASGNVSTT